MRKIVSILILTALLLTGLCSCSASKPYSEGQGELKIVASTFVPFDFAREIAGERATVTLLQTNGTDLHDYSPTTASLKAIAEADIFICIGGASDDTWTANVLKASENKNLRVIKLTELVHGELAELEGHSDSEYCEQNHRHDEHNHETHSADDGHGHVSDEHVWTSLENAEKAVLEIAKICTEIDPDGADVYTQNALRYTHALDNLDEQYEQTFDASAKKTLVFADRFPFIYLTHEYDACYYAAFSGCGTEAGASFETAVRLTEAVKHNGLKYVIVTESSDNKLAKSICDSTGCQILTLNSMQSVSLSEIKDGITYLKVMTENLAQLQKALA